MDKQRNYNSLKKFCLDQGLDLFGVADIKGIKDEIKLQESVLKSLNSAVSLGVRLSSAILSEILVSPTKLYFHHYRTVNAFLDQAALKISNYIQRIGFFALPIPASQIVDWQAQNAHLSHKKIGYLAGIGWIGRNNLLVNKKLGSKFRLVTILTDMPLKINKLIIGQLCGECVACIQVCPANAIKENPKDFDHLACFEKTREFQKKKIVDQFICGICVNVCPGRRR